MITWANKTVGDLFTAANANEVKSVVNSLFTAYLNYFDFSSESVTNVVVADTWYKLNTDTTEGFSRNGLVHTNNRVTYTGDSTKVFKIIGIASISSGNNNILHVAFFKNGAIHPCSEQTVTTSGSGKASNIAFQCLIELGTNDFIEVYTKNQSGTTNITLDNINVIVEQL
jgi:hypothetical protein